MSDMEDGRAIHPKLFEQRDDPVQRIGVVAPPPARFDLDECPLHIDDDERGRGGFERRHRKFST
jgi:hypothetical protein